MNFPPKANPGYNEGMGILNRIRRKEAEGFREFVCSLETTYKNKRKDIFQAGVLDDAAYMIWISQNMLNMKRISDLPEEELEKVIIELPNPVEVLCKALFKMPEIEEVVIKKLPQSITRKYAEEKGFIEKLTLNEHEGAQFFIYQEARKLQETGGLPSLKWSYPPQDLLINQKVNVDSGVWANYYEGGEVSAKGSMKNFMREGPWEHFYEDGSLRAKGMYSKGKKTGPWKFWKSNGDILAEGVYSEDERAGEWMIVKDGEEITKNYG